MNRVQRQGSQVGFLLTVLGTMFTFAQDAQPVIAVTGGQVQGSFLASGGAVFKGVSFAAPPVDDLRWREPIPPKTWNGIRTATTFGAPCAQRDFGSGFAVGASKISSEDCLYLNVWTPDIVGRFPVMLWIHGGGNFAGAAASDVYGDGSGNTYDGESLTRRGVVVVTANYRLTTFGFFAHPDLSAESPHRASGNYGLLDQIAALRWIRQNIARFGGDPDNVTVFGESSGATDVGVLMASPLARGFFHRAIAESGTIAGTPRALVEAEADGRKLADGLKVPRGNSLPSLRKLPTTEILNSTVPLITLTVGAPVFDT